MYHQELSRLLRPRGRFDGEHARVDSSSSKIDGVQGIGSSRILEWAEVP